MKIGITSPRFHIGWNTDLKIQSFFLKPGISDDLVFSYCGGLRYSSGLVFQKFLKKIGYDFPGISIRGNRLDSHRHFYCYGRIPLELYGRLSAGEAKAVLTTGVMTPHYMQSAGDSKPQHAKIIDLDKNIPEHVPFHFHTNYGLNQFKAVSISGRPAYSVPFFLPALQSYCPSQSKTEMNIAFVGKDGTRKGLYVLLEALKILPTSDLSQSKTKLIVVSETKPYSIEGVEIEWIKQASPEKVRKILCKSQILAMPVRHESYGIIFIEAMAAGCLVISDNDYPRHEIIGDAGKRLIDNSAEELASVLHIMLNDRDQIYFYRKKARERFMKFYSPEVVSREYVRIFKSLQF